MKKHGSSNEIGTAKLKTHRLMSRLCQIIKAEKTWRIGSPISRSIRDDKYFRSNWTFELRVVTKFTFRAHAGAS